MTEKKCNLCDGKGWIVNTIDGVPSAMRCNCTATAKKGLKIELPERTRPWHLKNFSTLENESLREALNIAKEYIKAFPAVDYGLLFTGPCGVGKSHLAVAILKEINESRGIRGRYADFNSLLFQLQKTIGSDGDRDVDAVLAPLIDTPLLVLDDFAASHGNSWTLDMVYHIINQRYLAKRHMIIATHYDVDQTLVKRVGAPLVSRLQEMCRVVVLEGDDHRREGIQTGYQFG